MKEALAGLFSSKKALATMAGMAATALITLAGKYGWALDPAAAKTLTAAVLGLVGLYVLGQGAADLGKEKAKIEAAAMALASTAKKAPETPSEPAEGSEPKVLTE